MKFKGFLFLGVLLISFGFTSQNSTVDPTEVGLEIGNIAPDLTISTPEGGEIKLSSLRGKIVLIDFWASWCGPCRRENPNVVSAYNKYSKAKFHDAKGFEIFSVSLDKNQKRWVEAIEKDQLSWDYHGSDLKGWNSAPAKVYSVRSIPASFLIDADGKIIGKNLRGERLHTEMDKLVKKFKKEKKAKRSKAS